MVAVEDLRKHLEYDPTTGIVSWVLPTSHSVRVGQQAGSISLKGYRKMTFLGRTISVHRIAWAMHYGTWPEKCIDHINGVRDDNRIVNLRDVSLSVNAMNRHVPRQGNFWKSTRGVSRHKSGRWQVQLYCPESKKVKYHGLFASEKEAESAARLLMAGRAERYL